MVFIGFNGVATLNGFREFNEPAVALLLGKRLNNGAPKSAFNASLLNIRFLPK
jgi:hypothetical protein